MGKWLYDCIIIGGGVLRWEYTTVSVAFFGTFFLFWLTRPVSRGELQ